VWPTSARFQAAMTRSHVRITRLDVLVGGAVAGQLGTLPDGSTYGGITGGAVEISRDPVRRRLTGLTVLDPERRYVRSTADGGVAWLWPYGVELRAWRGIDYQDGTTEMFPLGTFEVTGNDEDQPSVEISGWDRGGTINAFRFRYPFQIDLGETLGGAIQRIIETRWVGPALTYHLSDPGWTSPMIVLAEQAEPWTEACKRLASAGGMDLHFDALGDVVLKAEARSDDVINPVASFHAGADGVRVGPARQSRSTEGHYNGIILTAENTDNIADGTGIIRAEVFDLNPASPTYAPRWGYRPRWVAHPWVRTNDQAIAAATSILRAELGRTDGYTITCLPLPLDVGDPVQVYPDRDDDATGASVIQLIDKITCPLGDGVMELETRGSMPLEEDSA
jgi:hypothetical protein